MKRMVSSAEAKANLAELLEAAANGDVIEVETGCGRFALVASEAYEKMAEKADAYDRQEAILWQRLEEARTMTFEVDPEDEEAARLAVEAIKEIRAEMRAERQAS